MTPTTYRLFVILPTEKPSSLPHDLTLAVYSLYYSTVHARCSDGSLLSALNTRSDEVMAVNDSQYLMSICYLSTENSSPLPHDQI
jgi:hypothetical protein